MSRDYTTTRKPAARKSKPRSQTNRRKKSGGNSGAGGLFWFVSGVAVGALLTAVILVPSMRPELPIMESQKTGESTRQEDKAPQFDFYELLTEDEVVVPDDTPAQQPEVRTSSKAKSQTSSQAEAAKPSEHFVLQAGSFRNAGDADSLRVQLLLMNLTANVESAKSKAGDTWYRVMVGPFESKGSMTSARSRLSSYGVETLVLKRK